MVRDFAAQPAFVWEGVQDPEGIKTLPVKQLSWIGKRVRGALGGINMLALDNYIHICFPKDAKTDAAYSLARAVGMWGGRHIGNR